MKTFDLTVLAVLILIALGVGVSSQQAALQTKALQDIASTLDREQRQ